MKKIILNILVALFILFVPAQSFAQFPPPPPAAPATPAPAAAPAAPAKAPDAAPPVAVNVLDSLKTTADTAELKTDSNLQTLLGRVLGAALALLGILFFGLTIYAGIKWMIARGNTGEVEHAKESLTNAIIGLIIVLIAYAITKFILALFV